MARSEEPPEPPEDEDSFPEEVDLPDEVLEDYALLLKEELRARKEEIPSHDELQRQWINLKIKQQKNYARYVFWLICLYLVTVFGFLYLAGTDCNGFSLDNSVLIAMLTTTTATVLGLFHVIVRRMFDANGSTRKSTPSSK